MPVAFLGGRVSMMLPKGVAPENFAKADGQTFTRLKSPVESVSCTTDLPGASAVADVAVGLDPGAASPWIGLGNLLAGPLGRCGESEAAYRWAIDLDVSLIGAERIFRVLRGVSYRGLAAAFTDANLALVGTNVPDYEPFANRQYGVDAPAHLAAGL